MPSFPPQNRLRTSLASLHISRSIYILSTSGENICLHPRGRNLVLLSAGEGYLPEIDASCAPGQVRLARPRGEIDCEARVRGGERGLHNICGEGNAGLAFLPSRFPFACYCVRNCVCVCVFVFVSGVVSAPCRKRRQLLRQRRLKRSARTQTRFGVSLGVQCFALKTPLASKILRGSIEIAGRSSDP